MPHIDSACRVDTTNRTLMEHSPVGYSHPFLPQLQEQKAGAINVKMAWYPNYSHMEIAVKTFQDALQWLMKVL